MNSLSGRINFRNRRVREKYCFLLVLMSFFIICVIMVFFLPDLRARTSAGVHDVYEKLPDLFLAPHMPIPAPASFADGDRPRAGLPKPLHPPPRYLEDRMKFQARMEEDEHRRVLEKPQILNNDKPFFKSSSPSPSPSQKSQVLPSSGGILSPNIETSNGKLPLNNHDPRRKQSTSNDNLAVHKVGHSVNSSGVIVTGGQDVDVNVQSQRDFIKRMMKDAWDNYRQYAWGHNELKPISQRGHSGSVFGAARMGATIVDAVDTLYIMGLEKEYKEGRDWIATNFDIDSFHSELSVFETNIRFVGGFLTMYSLTGDTMYKDKAYQLAKKLLPAFDTPTGIPYALVTLNGDGAKNYGWASSGSSILSEFGTLHLEFVYLSDITGDPIFREKVYKIRDVIKQAEKSKGLYSNYLHPRMGKFTQNHVSMGALGDSFYEYLLKSYIQTGDTDARQMYDEAMDAFEKNGLIRYSKNGLLYFAEMRYDRIESKMDHLACFAGGMLALGAHTDPNVSGTPALDARVTRHLKIAEGITNTCHESYIRTETHLGPESFRFSDAMEARGLRQNEKYYILRPEVLESYFILWRITGDPKYREWGWDAAQSIEKWCKAGPGGGYSGLRNVYSKEPQQDDVQQSFFLAETLKYLYLLFSSKELLDLDFWVFNTEAHPLPIKGVNPFYRPYQSSPH